MKALKESTCFKCEVKRHRIKECLVTRDKSRKRDNEVSNPCYTIERKKDSKKNDQRTHFLLCLQDVNYETEDLPNPPSKVYKIEETRLDLR